VVRSAETPRKPIPAGGGGLIPDGGGRVRKRQTWWLKVSGGPPGRRTATPQACDLQFWCAVRDLNPEPADITERHLVLVEALPEGQVAA